jgi:ribosomal protein S3AE
LRTSDTEKNWYLLIAPEGIEIAYLGRRLHLDVSLLIAPEGIEIL